MPAGLPYFAWIDASETTFGDEHLRWDESVFSFELKQDEGDPASLTVTVRRPRNEAGNTIGLLGPDRKIWAWFALDCGPALVKFRGRLVGIPTSIFEELVTLEFVAKPVDLVAQKAALADTLRVLPYYDEAVIDEQKRDDPDIVLEGYTAIWHYDRETLGITVSDEINGEDGLVEFDGESETGKVLYDGLGLTLTSGPLSRIDVNAEYTWTQQGSGTVDLTQFIVSSWSALDPIVGYVTNPEASIKFKAADWPKHGASLGEGWEVADSTADDLFPQTSSTQTSGSTNIVKYAGNEAHTTTYTSTTSQSGGGIGVSTAGGPTTVSDDIKITRATDGDGHSYQSGYSRNYSSSSSGFALQAIQPTLVAGYTAGRECTERISFSLFADVQSILTDPDDGEALRLDDVKSVNLSEDMGGELPIGDPRRRSYIATERGNRSLEHLILLARAHLMKRARVVEITFAPKLERMPEITLRKNCFLIEPRVGEAVGKIIGYSLGLDGSDGRPKCEVRIGCTIGRGGTAVASGGDPTYCSIDYVGADYQQMTARTILLGPDVGYEPPSADPNDDGLDLLSNLSASDVIEVPLSLHIGPEEEGEPDLPEWSGVVGADNQDTTEVFNQKAMAAQQRRAKFKLKSMTRDFSTEYEVLVTDLKIPTGIDLEAV